jgi:hypothetical protein
MKTIRILSLFLLAIVASCSSIRVASDYDNTVDFSKYKTFSFLKSGIDKVPISEFDKKRIMKSIETELGKKGITRSETPDLLVNFFTKESQVVDASPYYYGGWGYGWGYGWGGTYVTTSTEGELYIDLIDAQKKELIWQGQGTGYLEQYSSQKDKKVNEFVAKILMQYPPGKSKK